VSQDITSNITGKQVHRIAVADPASGELVAALLAELQNTAIRGRTPQGEAVSFMVSTWRRDEAGAFVVQFSPLAAARLAGTAPA
jgi:hypothetical protein